MHVRGTWGSSAYGSRSTQAQRSLIEMMRRLKLVPRRALVLVSAQAVSSLGSSITAFALDVWIFEKTHSYTVFALLALLSSVPGLLFSPVAGIIVDRFSRQRVIIASDATAAACMVMALVANLFDRLSPSLVGMVVMVLALARTMRWPATSAAITTLTDESNRPGVNGLLETFGGAVGFLGPLFGAGLFSMVGLSIIICLDVTTYLLCIVVVARIPFGHSLPSDRVGATARRGPRIRTLIGDCSFGFVWIFRHRDLGRLLLFIAAINTGSAVFVVAYAPYVLSFSNADVLGTSLALMSVGMMAGGALFAATGGLKRRDVGVLVGAILLGICEAAIGLVRSRTGLLAISVLYGGSIPLLNASSQTIWQSRVPSELQGRVFAVRKMIAWALNPISIVLSIPAITMIFGPVLVLTVLDARLEKFWGSGQTGALGLMISVCGLFCTTLAVVLLSVNGLRMQDGTEAHSRTTTTPSSRRVRLAMRPKRR